MKTNLGTKVLGVEEMEGRGPLERSRSAFYFFVLTLRDSGGVLELESLGVSIRKS